MGKKQNKENPPPMRQMMEHSNDPPIYVYGEVMWYIINILAIGHSK